MSAAATPGELRQPSVSPANLLRRWFEEVWNQGDDQAIDQLLAKDATMWGVGRPDVSSIGSDEFKKFHRAMHEAYSSIHIHLDQVVQEGDTAFARWTVTGTLSATNNQMTLKGMSACRVQNGMIIEGWNIWDQIGMARQLGALTGQAAVMFP
jgi:ketosteroid isomerase-like protein